MTNTPLKPCPDAVEALAEAIKRTAIGERRSGGFYGSHNIEPRHAIGLIRQLATKGYHLTSQPAMTDAELEREAENLANCYALNRDKIREKIVDLAKKYRG